MKKIKETIIENVIKNYYNDENMKSIERKTLSNYVKDNFNIELLEYDLLSLDESKKTNYNTTVKIFENGKLIKRKLFWTGYNKWNGYSKEDLINETIKLIKNCSSTTPQQHPTYIAGDEHKNEYTSDKRERYEWDDG
jgi:arsenate reductase-like glutaredoxin family protein